MIAAVSSKEGGGPKDYGMISGWRACWIYQGSGAQKGKPSHENPVVSKATKGTLPLRGAKEKRYSRKEFSKRKFRRVDAP